MTCLPALGEWSPDPPPIVPAPDGPIHIHVIAGSVIRVTAEEVFDEDTFEEGELDEDGGWEYLFNFDGGTVLGPNDSPHWQNWVDWQAPTTQADIDFTVSASNYSTPSSIRDATVSGYWTGTIHVHELEIYQIW
ncbi:MAG: hypothetical protein GF320_03575, partial [Armatimonadia bacterium]|nr:hypothetical protein [Armatimonadia bacterium]